MAQEIFLQITTKIIVKFFFDDRGIKETLQYETAVLDYPTLEEMAQFNNVTHVWTSTDRLWKLSSQYYGSPGMWWCIAWYNKKPTESHFSVGDVVYIPMPPIVTGKHY